MQRLERGFTKRVAKILNKAANDAADAVETYGQAANIEAVLRWMDDEMQSAFITQYTVAAQVFGKRILDAFKSCQHYETKADAQDVFKETMEIWIRKEAAKKVVGVNKTTKTQIRGVIDEGFGQSLPASTVANAIVERTGGAIAKQRAKIIARTETHMAAQQSSVEAVRSTGVPVKKVWIAAADERTRTEHMEADSDSHANPLARDEMFVVGGDSMDAPGLGSDPAQNVNCRCQVAYITEWSGIV